MGRDGHQLSPEAFEHLHMRLPSGDASTSGATDTGQHQARERMQLAPEQTRTLASYSWKKWIWMNGGLQA